MPARAFCYRYEPSAADRRRFLRYLVKAERRLIVGLGLAFPATPMHLALREIAAAHRRIVAFRRAHSALVRRPR